LFNYNVITRDVVTNLNKDINTLNFAHITNMKICVIKTKGMNPDFTLL